MEGGVKEGAGWFAHEWEGRGDGAELAPTSLLPAHPAQADAEPTPPQSPCEHRAARARPPTGRTALLPAPPVVAQPERGADVRAPLLRLLRARGHERVLLEGPLAGLVRPARHRVHHQRKLLRHGQGGGAVLQE